ncbi:A-kinase anchor protein 11 isoform X5 [Fukomys damarensis]|uniref:A-kinase anchor protein 11 isoform X5 n=1 Tax=Fukomys damarensis TaxID=885580 RepID=UPI00053FEE7C|nr:A-kinase anchor protein 11 isoform X5 [Fukomys damarensis]
MATFQPFRNSHVKPRRSVRKSFSEDVFQSVKSLLQSEKELCSISGEDCLKQDEHANLTEVTFLGFNEETDAAHIQDLAAVSLELPDLLNSLHFCSLNENEIICMKDINKSSDVNSSPLNQSHHSGMLCVMRVSPTLPRLRIDFIFSLLSKYATGIRYTLDTYLHQNCQLETTHEDDDDDTNQSVSSIEDDFVTAFEQLEEEEASRPYSDGINSTTLRSQCGMASQTICGHHLETHDLKILVSSGQQKSLAKPSSPLINVLGHEESHSVKNSVTTSISEPWVQRSFYRSSNASDKSSDAQKTFFSSSPAYSSESECSSPSPVIFLDEEGYQKSLKAKLELPKIPVMKDDVEDSDSEMAFNELRRQHAFSLKQRAISGLANFLVSEAFSHALKDLQYVKKQIFTNTVAKFAADLAEELVFEGIMEVCQFSYPSTPASLQCQSFDFEDKVMKSYAEDLSESVIQEAFIELSQVDVPFTTKAAVSVSTDNIKYVNAESVAPSTQTFTISPFNNQAVTVTKPVQEYKKEYTVQQALFCTSGIVTSIPVPLAGSALLPYHISFTVCHTNSHLSLDDSNTNGDSTQAHVMSKNKEEEVGCPRNICLLSEHNLVSQNDCKPTNNDIEIQSSSKLTSDPVIISNFSAAMVHTIVNETLESMTLFKVAKTVDENTDCLTKTIKGHASPFSHQAAPQQGEATNKDTFAELFSKSVIKDSIDTSKSIKSTTNTNIISKEGLPVAGEESQSTSEKFPKFLDAQDHLPCCSLSMRKDCVQECKDSMVHGISLETLSPCPMMASQKPDLKELAKDKPVKKHNLNDTALEPLSFGQESPLRRSHTISSTVLTCVDGLHVEDKQKIRDRNIIPDTPPSTPLVPSQASSEWDIKKLTKKLKGELAKEFAPATPPSTPHNSSVGSLSESEHNTIEKEEFMLKLMRSLSEEVESSEGEEHPEMNVKLEHSGKKVQFAEALATHIISFATEMAASHLDHKITQEPEAQKPCFSVQSQGKVLPVFLSHSDENFQTCIFAGDMAAEIITEAEKIAKARSSVLHRKKKNLCFIDGDQDYRSEETLDMEVVAHPREVDPFILSLPPSSMSGLTYKYPSCESVTDEYAGHVIQMLKQEGGNGELIMDQFANRLAYRSVKSGLQEAAKTAKMKCSSKIFPVQSAPVKINSELLMFSNKEQHREVGKKSKRKRNGGHLCQNQTCERTRDTCRNEDSHLYSFSASLARCITRDVKKELMAPKVDLPKSLTDSCLFEKSGYVEDTECLTEPEFSTPLQLSSQNQGYHHSTGNLNRRACGENIVQAIEQYAKKVVDDTLELGLGSKVFQSSETTKSVDRITYAEKLSPLTNQNCRYCDRKELHDCTGNSTQHFFRQDSRVSSKLVTNSKFSNICQKSRIFHLDVPQIHVNLDKKSLLAEKIVAEAIERAERELSNTSLAADSGIGQDGISFAESLTTEIMTSAMLNVGHTVSSSKEIEDAQSTESLGSQQMNLSIGEDSIGSWSNLSFEDEHQDESSSFHHLSESSNGNSSSWSSLGLEGDLYEDNLSFPTSDSDEPDDKDEEHEDDGEGLEQDGKTLLITNIDMEPCTVDPQLRIILQWLISSEAEVAELYFHDSSKKDFILLSKWLQEKGWKVGDLLQAVLKYYEVVEKASSEERCKSLFDWLLENA